MHEARAVLGAVLDLAGLDLLDRLRDLERDRAAARVGHLALRPEHAAEPADDGHHVRRRERDVEVGPALLHARREIVGAHVVGAGLLGRARVLALGEHGDRLGAAGAVRQHQRAAQLLVGVAHVEAEPEVRLDGLVELAPSRTT